MTLKFAQALGAIKRVQHMPCAVPPLIYIESFVPAVINVVRSNVEPVWKQAIKAATGKSWLKHIKHRLVNAEHDLPAAFSNGLEHLYTVAEFLDKAVFYMWVAGMSADFVYQWASLVRQYTPCAKAVDQQIISGYDCIGGFVPDINWVPGPSYVNKTGTGPPLWGCDATVPPNQLYNMMFVATWPSSQVADYRVTCRIRNTRTDEIMALSGSVIITHQHTASSFCYASHLPGGDHGTLYIGEVQLELIKGALLIAIPTKGALSVQHLGIAPESNPRPKKKWPKKRHFAEADSPRKPKVTSERKRPATKPKHTAEPKRPKNGKPFRFKPKASGPRTTTRNKPTTKK